MNPRDARGRISETRRSHACSDQSVGIKDSGRERKAEKMEGHETGNVTGLENARRL
jgi:hypothetical protein